MRFPEAKPLAAAFAMRPGLAGELFGSAELARVHAVADLDETVTIDDFGRADARLLAALDVLITGWDAPVIGPAELDAMPRLRAILHAAGSVKGLLTPEVWSRGILVTTAADANARPVAEYTLAAILLAGKDIPALAMEYARDPSFRVIPGTSAHVPPGTGGTGTRAINDAGGSTVGTGTGHVADGHRAITRWSGANYGTPTGTSGTGHSGVAALAQPQVQRHLPGRPGIGNYGRTMGIIGASRVGRQVIDLLGPFDFRVLLYDPQVRADDPVLRRVERTGLADLLRRSSIVSVHAPLLPETRGMLGSRQLALMSPGSVLINTARGDIVDHDALIGAVRDGGLRAILDVTSPEPLPADHPLRGLPGVILTPHVAGSLGNELRRLGQSVTTELELFAAGRPPRSPVHEQSLTTMALSAGGGDHTPPARETPTQWIHRHVPGGHGRAGTSPRQPPSTATLGGPGVG